MEVAIALLGLALPILVTGLLALSFPMKASSLRLLLAFSAAYLFSLSIMHMLPEAVAVSSAKRAGLFIIVGFSLQLIIDTFSTGIEHGHVHLHSNTCHKHLPYGIIIGLFLHSFLEGLPVYEPTTAAVDVNYQLVLGLGVHNLPITIALSALLREHSKNRFRQVVLLTCFALMSPLGFLFSYLLHTVGLSDYQSYSEMAYALVIGIFLYISTAILFESGDQHKYNLRKVLAMVVGVIVAYLLS